MHNSYVKKYGPEGQQLVHLKGVYANACKHGKWRKARLVLASYRKLLERLRQARMKRGIRASPEMLLLWDAEYQAKTSMNQDERKRLFIEELARFLVSDQAAKSALLQIESKRPEDDPRPKLALEWSKLRQVSTIVGYAEHGEAVITLTKLLS